MLHRTISLRALVLVSLLAMMALTGSDVAHSAPSADLLTSVDGIIFSPAGEGARDIRSFDNDGCLRIYNANGQLTNPPEGAAIQFCGNDRNVFNGQAFIDSGSHPFAAIIFRTAASGAVGERMRIDAQGRVTAGSVTNSNCTGPGDICAGDALVADADVFAGSDVRASSRVFAGTVDSTCGAGDICAGDDLVADDTITGGSLVVAGTVENVQCVGGGDICADNNLTADVRVYAGVVESARCNDDGDICAGRDLVADVVVYAGTVEATFCASGGDICAGDDLLSDGDLFVGSGCIMNGAGTPIGGSCPSDLRLKRRIEPLSSMLAELTALQPVTFDWRRDEFPDLQLSSERGFGLIAQDVEQVLPDLVTEKADGFKAVHYERLPILLLQAMRELKAAHDVLVSQNEQLQEEKQAQDQRIATLEQRNATLEARLVAIEQRLNGGTAPLVAAR